MKRLAFILLLLCHSAFGAAAFVQGASNPGGGAATLTASLAGTVAGNALVMMQYVDQGTADFNVCTDNNGDIFNIYVSEASNGGVAAAICVAFNTVGGSVTGTCKTYSGGAFVVRCSIAEFSGVYAVDNIAYAQTSGASSLSYNTTTNLSGDMLVGMMYPNTCAPGSVPTGWTQLTIVEQVYQLATTAGSYGQAWSWGCSQPIAAVTVALKAGPNPAIGTSPSTTFYPFVNSGQSNANICPFGKNVKSGDILIAAASSSLGSTITGISDTVSSSWTSITTNSSQMVSQVWKATAGSSGADAITFTYTGSPTAQFMQCVELPSALATTTVDAFLSGSYEGTPRILSTSSLTTTVNGDVLLLFTTSPTGTANCWTSSPMIYITGTQCALALGTVVGANQPAIGSFNLGASAVNGNFILVALKPASALTLYTSSLPSASTSHSYSYPLYAVQGVGSYTWSISSGLLPTGLSINSSTGVISGTPTGGTQTFTAKVTDSASNTATQSLTLTVNSSVSTPSFIQGVLNQLGTTLAFTSLSTNDVLWVAAENENYGGGGVIATPTDTLGTTFQLAGCISNVFYPVLLAPTNTCVWGGQVSSSGADTVTFASGQFVPAGMQFRNVQPFFDSTVFTTGPQTTANQTFTSTGLTTTAPNSMSAGVVTVNPGAPSSIAAQSPYTDGGNITGDTHIVDLGYDVVSAVGSTAFSSAIVGGSTSAAWGMAMTNLRPSTSGAVSTNHRRAWVIER